MKKPIEQQMKFLEEKIERYFTDLTEDERKYFLKDFQQTFSRYKQLVHSMVGNYQSQK